MIDFFKTLNIFTTEELQILHLLPKRTLKKGEYLIEEGSVCNEIAYISKGILRLFYTSPIGEEITSCLAFENDLFSAYTSFITEKPTEENIQAACDTELIILSRDFLNILYNKGAAWQKAGRLIAEMHYVELSNKIVEFQKYSAKQRYQELRTKHPQYIEAIPQHQIASLLGITPRHFSRLKKELQH